MTRFALIAALVASVSVQNASAAFVWAELGDAGSFPGTAQTINQAGNTPPLTNITGSISSSTDFDLFRFVIASPSTFSASTVDGTTTLSDTQLFLFNITGFGIATNDDSVVARSVLPVGNALYASLPAGEYLVGISGFNVDPNSVGGLIFPNTFSGVNGPTGPGGGSPFSALTGTGGTGTYNITLTGADGVNLTPAPAAVWMGLAGMGALAALRRRFKKA